MRPSSLDERLTAAALIEPCSTSDNRGQSFQNPPSHSLGRRLLSARAARICHVRRLLGLGNVIVVLTSHLTPAACHSKVGEGRDRPTLVRH